MIKREFRKSYVERFGEGFVKAFEKKIKSKYFQYVRVNISQKYDCYMYLTCLQ